MGGEKILDEDEGGEDGDRWVDEDGGGEKGDNAREGATFGSVSWGTGFSVRKETRVDSEVSRLCSGRSNRVAFVGESANRSFLFDLRQRVYCLVTRELGISFADSSSSSGRRRSRTSLIRRIGSPDISQVKMGECLFHARLRG